MISMRVPVRTEGGSATPVGSARTWGRNRLAILPGVTHYDMHDSAALAPIALTFLDSGK